MQLLKIGNHLINTNHIIDINLKSIDWLKAFKQNQQKEISCVSITTTEFAGSIGYEYNGAGSFESRTFKFYEAAAEALRGFFLGTGNNYNQKEIGQIIVVEISNESISLSEIENREFPAPPQPSNLPTEDLPF